MKSFQEQMKNPEASTDEEIMCEKFFLMVQHNRFWMQAIAMDYFIEIYDDPAIRACFKEKYGFKREDFWEIMTEKGLASVLIGK